MTGVFEHFSKVGRQKENRLNNGYVGDILYAVMLVTIMLTTTMMIEEERGLTNDCWVKRAGKARSCR